ncbi:MAG: hypothetical protein U0821_20595 [Chloroflexota bacterium]
MDESAHQDGKQTPLIQETWARWSMTDLAMAGGVLLTGLGLLGMLIRSMLRSRIRRGLDG